MKYLITNKQFNLLMESTEDKILMLPNPERIGGWHILQQLLEKKGNPRYGIRGDLDLRGVYIESLGNLERVEGNLVLFRSSIKSLGNLKYVGGYLKLHGASHIQSLGNLEYVEGDLVLFRSSIESLGNLEYVGGNLDLRLTPLSKTTTKEEIKSKVNVVGKIYF